MTEYSAPIRDMIFAMTELFDADAHYKGIPGGDDINAEFLDVVLSEAGKFCANETNPIYQSGDEEGCTLDKGVVRTPNGFQEAYAKARDNGWISITGCPEFGGQGLPVSLGTAVTEIFASSNQSFTMFMGLSHGAIRTLDHHGTDAQKEAFLPNLVSGNWSGTMCLTEPHCGTDLGLLKTRAKPQDDGSYTITGTKIFVSAGDHDLTDNIIHIVLARLPDAPKGIKGVSLFVVPKRNIDADGTVGESNSVTCGSVEHKHGIKACPACVMNFDEAKGYLVGEPHKGMRAMFVFMNAARVGVAQQGTAHAERAFQGALAYAKDRLQMRSLSGPKAPEKPADPIIVHPDVRRMLLTIKSFSEGGRALCFMMARLLDRIESGVASAEDEVLLSFLTPIAKLFLTETGYEAASLGVQVFGGHGYIKEWGMEQNLRDARIATIYEGTTGIQALDLLGRKVLQTQGESLRLFTKKIHTFCKENKDNAELAEFVAPLAAQNAEWGELTQKIGIAALQNPDEVGAASVDYGMYSGYVTLAYLWARTACVAQNKLAAGEGNSAFYQAKIDTARFYFKRILPRTSGLAETMLAGAPSLMDMQEEAFSF